ncbi:HAD family acid phosphatase [Sphingomonas xinjiangensis]|uniref:5'-nucleotidase (Lipoprotein e(P4) family) n=1 Tax=Sphingomonas xinjiangensis TaxID=643568 RepID=A0A840YC32_9SPHN|nr:HAD family acid phosphatase [Sphingomonas xinjiangensis]MBB5709579.1 5'-nucleotidase (lipoprotein e(P4) family) [Sphingomonas xinjiangensis]
MSVVRLSAAVLAGAGFALSGCIAAAVPVAAAGGIYKVRQDRQDKRERRAKRDKQVKAPVAGQVIVTPDGKRVTVTGLTQLPAPDGTVAAKTNTGNVPPEMQYLYGSGEAAALSYQAYQALWNYLRVEIGYLRDKSQAKSVVLSPGSTLDNLKFETCGKRPMAVVLDVDETVLQNLGYEADAAARGGGYDAGRWSRWEQTGAEQVLAVPGAAEALAAARREGFTVIFNSNRSAATAPQTVAALEHAGLGPAVLGETLWLRGEGEPSGKDARRARISQHYCIVAMAGDQLGDFSDLFNAPELGVQARRSSAGVSLVAPLWGAGWFMLPNPVYGTGLKGGMDDVFPPAVRWTDPQEKK